MFEGPAAQYDVRFDVNTGQFARDMGEIHAVADKTYGGLSDASLRAAVAQERYDRVLARNYTDSFAAAKATAVYKSELQSIAVAAQRAADAEARRAAAATRAGVAAASSVGHALTNYVAAPTAVAAYAAIKLGFDFEKSMELIRTQAGATTTEMKNASAGVLELVQSGDSFGQTAKDMAQGLFFIESEGVRGAKALDILKVAAAGAAVGQNSLASTSDALTSAMKVYKLEAGDAAATMATLNAIVGAGKMHMEDLTAALGTKFLPVSAQLGISLDQAGAALDVFTQTGVPAQSAATNLTTAFLKMLNPTAQSEKALRLMGIGSKTLARELQSGGLPAALGLLSKRYQQLVADQGKVTANQAVVTAFGGVRGGAAVLTLVQQYEGYMKDLQRVQAQNSPATFWKSVAQEMNLPAEKIKRDVVQIEAELIKLGIVIGPLVADIVGGVTTIAGAFTHLPGPIKDELGIIVGILAVGGPLLLAGAGVVKMVGTIGTAFEKLGIKAAAGVVPAEAELTALGATAVRTEAQVAGVGAGFAALPASAAAGAGAAEAELVGVGGAATVAAGEVSALSLGLLGLGALVIAPIVIPIITRFIADEQSHHTLGHTQTGGDAKLNTEVFEQNGKYYERVTVGRNVVTKEITAKDAGAALGFLTSTNKQDAKGRAPGGPAAPPSKKAPNTGGGGGSTAAPLGALERITLAVSRAQLAVVRGDKGAQQQLVAALNDEVAYDEKYAAIEENLIRKGIGDRKTHAKILNSLLSDEQGAYSQIDSIRQQNAQAAAEASRKASERRKKAAEALKKQREKEIAQLTQAPVALRIQEANAIANGASAEKQVAILEREKKALEAQVVTLKKIGASKADILKARTNEASIQKKIDALKKKSGSGNNADSIREFLSEFENVINTNAPNYLKPAPAAKAVPDVHFHYASPTPDLHREVTQAKIAVLTDW